MIDSRPSTNPDLTEVGYSIGACPPSARRQYASKCGRIALIALIPNCPPLLSGLRSPLSGLTAISTPRLLYTRLLRQRHVDFTLITLIHLDQAGAFRGQSSSPVDFLFPQKRSHFTLITLIHLDQACPVAAIRPPPFTSRSRKSAPVLL
jgi:hypothetical protein